MSGLSIVGAQWWDYAMIVLVILGCIAYLFWIVVSWFSKEYVSFLHSVDWRGRFNTYDVYGICVEVRSRKHLRLVVEKRNIIVVHIFGILRDNSTWEEAPFWMLAQIQNYVAKNTVPIKTSVEIAHTIVKNSAHHCSFGTYGKRY